MLNTSFNSCLSFNDVTDSLQAFAIDWMITSLLQNINKKDVSNLPEKILTLIFLLDWRRSVNNFVANKKMLFLSRNICIKSIKISAALGTREIVVVKAPYFVIFNNVKRINLFEGNFVTIRAVMRKKEKNTYFNNSWWGVLRLQVNNKLKRIAAEFV